MLGYYVEKLSGNQLRQCYDIAPPRVKQYLEAEIRAVTGYLEPGDRVLELGCGYGRVTFRLAETAKSIVGIDTSSDSIALARQIAGSSSRCEFLVMDAVDLSFDESEFDKIVCIQNGICAFGVNREILLHEALRVARPGGRILFSTYSERFWPNRLEWFEAQSAAGLVGEIDYDKTGNGTIVCKDDFHSGMMSPEELLSLGEQFGLETEVGEIDESSVFCTIVAPKTA